MILSDEEICKAVGCAIAHKTVDEECPYINMDKRVCEIYGIGILVARWTANEIRKRIEEVMLEVMFQVHYWEGGGVYSLENRNNEYIAYTKWQSLWKDILGES